MELTQEWIVGNGAPEDSGDLAGMESLDDLLSEPETLSWDVTGEQLIALWAAALGREYDAALEPLLSDSIVRGLTCWQQINPEFVAALAGIDAEQLPQVARQWGRLVELGEVDRRGTRQALKVLVKLARRTRKSNSALWLVVHAPY